MICHQQTVAVVDPFAAALTATCRALEVLGLRAQRFETVRDFQQSRLLKSAAPNLVIVDDTALACADCYVPCGACGSSSGCARLIPMVVLQGTARPVPRAAMLEGVEEIGRRCKPLPLDELTELLITCGLAVKSRLIPPRRANAFALSGTSIPYQPSSFQKYSQAKADGGQWGSRGFCTDIEWVKCCQGGAVDESDFGKLCRLHCKNGVHAPERSSGYRSVRLHAEFGGRVFG